MSKILSFMVGILLLLTNTSFSEQRLVEVSDAYEFLSPKEQGIQIESHEQMVDYYQVPEDILKKMSTEGLVETCLHYPLFGEITAYNSPQQGFSIISKRFNGFKELMNRPGAGEILINVYTQTNPLKIDQHTTLDFLYVELLLSQNDILSNLTQEEKNILFKEVLNKTDMKIQSDRFSIYSFNALGLIMGKIIKQKSPYHELFQDKEVSDFFEDKTPLTSDIFNKIYNTSAKSNIK